MTNIIKQTYRLFATALIVLTMFSSTALAARPTTPTASAGGCEGLESVGEASDLFPQYCSANDLLIKVISYTFMILGALSALFIIIGGFQYVTSAGSKEKAKKATDTLTYAVAGLALALLAYSIIAIVTNTLTEGLGPENP